MNQKRNQLRPLTPWQRKMSDEAYRRAVAAGDPDPLGFVAQLMAESEMNPTAVSPADARGLAQFIPATAARMGLKNPNDPIASIDAAIRYRKVIREYNAKRGLQGEEYVWAGYNAGEGRSHLARHKFSETIGYVDRINAYRPQLSAMLGVPPGGDVAGAAPPGGAPSTAPSGAQGMMYSPGSESGGRVVNFGEVPVQKFEPAKPVSMMSDTPLSDFAEQQWKLYLNELQR